MAVEGAKPRRVKLPKHLKPVVRYKAKPRRISVPEVELTREMQIADTVRALQGEIEGITDKLLKEQYLHAMTEVAKDGDLSHMIELTRYRRGLVPLDEFLHSETYLGINPKEIYPAVRETLEAVETEQYVEAILKGSIGIGKMLCVDTPILTTKGWKRNGDLVAGDKVYDEKGNICNVLVAHPIKKSPKSYRVVFSDGTSIDACSAHLWYTETRADRLKKRAGTVKTTEEIRKTLIADKRFKNHSIPLHSGVKGKPSKFDIDPYVLGCWLGSGSSEESRFYCHDNDYEVVQLMEAAGASMRRLEYVQEDRCPTYLIEASGCIGFRNALARYNLLGNKHLPEALLLGSYEQRLALLQGLMDTDGTCSKQTGVCEITLVDKNLSDGVMQLLWLLGLKPTQSLKSVNGKNYYRITFTAYRDMLPVFRLARKLALQPVAGTQAIRQRSRYIVDVQSIAPKKMRCITVDSPSHLYLAGRQLVPTHNTTAANLGIIRQIYKIACMRNPHQTFGLQRHSSIVFTIQSVRLSTAKRAVFDELGKFIHGSPFFNEIYPYDKRIASSMYFREHHVQILPVSSSDTGAISMNVIGGMLDEVNFMERVKNSKNANADESGEYDQAKTLYLTLSKRRRSRFMNKGKLPGTLFLVSSSRYPDDFTEVKAAESVMQGGTDPEIFVLSKSLWEGRGRDKYSEDEFRVLIGNERQRPRILGPDEIVGDPDAHIITVPQDLRSEFEKDIGGAIRDFAGLTTLASRPFIQNRESLFECMALADQYDYQSVIPLQEIDLEVSQPFIIPERVRNDVKQMRVAHVDLAMTRDSAGIAVGHIAGTKTIERIQAETGQRIVEVLPVIAYDCILRVLPPRDGEIDFAKIRQIIYDLRDKHGLPIKVVTTDGFQCLSGFSEVWTSRGMVRACDIIEGDIVQSRIGPRPVTKKWSFGVQPALRITTKDGHSITVTEGHKLEVASQNRLGGTSIWKWKKAKDMRIGDILHTWEGDTGVDAEFNGLTPELARLYGLIYGDGDFTDDGQIRIACAHDEIREAAKVVRAAYEGDIRVDYGINRVSFTNGDFVRQMLADGFDKKGIPDKLKQAPRAVQAAFLSGLFAADGTVKKRDGQPSLSTCHAWIAEYVRNFLRMAYGIATHTTVVDRSVAYKGTFYTERPYQYIVSVKGSRRAFHDAVGFAYATKQAQLAKHLDVTGRRIGSRIVSIEACEADVYDFEVEEDHAYLANGIVCHNSVDFRQILAKKGFVTEYISLDRTTQPYRTFRDALYDKRVLLPRHQTLIKELTELEYVQNGAKEKIDHKPRGSKDVADAVCGVATFLLTRRQTWHTQPLYKGMNGLMLHGNRTGTGSVVLEEVDDFELDRAGAKHGRPIVHRRSLNRLKQRKRKTV